MKRMISLAICVLMVFAISLPAFAEEAPTEYVPDGNIDLESTGGNFIISRDCEVDNFDISDLSGNVTLTIAKGVTVTVKDNFNNFGTINVDGTLILFGTNLKNNFGTINVSGTLTLSDTYNKNNFNNFGTINVFTCGGGWLAGNVNGPGTVSKDKHHFVNGFCSFCGEKACEHKNLKTVCADCREVISTYSATPTENTGSVLSEGYPEILYGIGGLAIGFLAAAFIFKKKKPALADGAESTGEE